jgi:hypothetical protein
MGKSAKLHKRVVWCLTSLYGTVMNHGLFPQPRKLKSLAQPASTQASITQNQVHNAQKKAARKNKAASAKSGKGNGPILGGADYVTLMMGGRRKAKEEAVKLYHNEDA